MTKYEVTIREYPAPYIPDDPDSVVRASLEFPGYGFISGFGENRDAALEDLSHMLQYARKRVEEDFQTQRLKDAAVTTVEEIDL